MSQNVEWAEARETTCLTMTMRQAEEQFSADAPEDNPGNRIVLAIVADSTLAITGTHQEISDMLRRATRNFEQVATLIETAGFRCTSKS